MNAQIFTAFPKGLMSNVTRLAASLDPDVAIPAAKPFMVICEGETLLIPQRIYPPVIAQFQFVLQQPLDQLITACWFTRHHDGHVREQFLRALPAFDNSWSSLTSLRYVASTLLNC